MADTEYRCDIQRERRGLATKKKAKHVLRAPVKKGHHKNEERYHGKGDI